MDYSLSRITIICVFTADYLLNTTKQEHAFRSHVSRKREFAPLLRHFYPLTVRKTKCKAASAKECCRCPQNRRLAVKVTGDSGPVQIKLQIVCLVGSAANIANIAIRLEVTHKREPSLPCRRAVNLCVKPAFLYAGYHCKSKHAGTGSFGIRLRMVD